MSSPSGKAEETPGFDVLLERLKGVVDKLEAGELSLEESLAAYEQGVALSRLGHELLDTAEKRVELLTRDSAGKQTTVPLDADDDEESD